MSGSNNNTKGNNKFPGMQDVFGNRPPPPRESTGDANKKTKGTKFPRLQDIMFTTTRPGTRGT